MAHLLESGVSDLLPIFFVSFFTNAGECILIRWEMLERPIGV